MAQGEPLLGDRVVALYIPLPPEFGVGWGLGSKSGTSTASRPALPKAQADASMLVHGDGTDPVGPVEAMLLLQLLPDVAEPALGAESLCEVRVDLQAAEYGLVSVRHLLVQSIRHDGGHKVAKGVGPVVRHHVLRQQGRLLPAI